MVSRSLRRRLRRLRGARNYVSKLARVSWRERADMLVAQWALIWAQVLVWTLPEGRLVSAADDSAEGVTPLVPASEAEVDAARELGLAMSRAAHLGLFRPKCLVRSVALHRMLERRGMHGGRIKVGVRLREGQFDAHAWVEYHGVVVGDRDWHVGQFAQLPGTRVRARG